MRPPRLLRPHRGPRPRSVHPLRASDDRRRPRRSRQGADRAGPRVPQSGHLRRDPGGPARGDPGRGGQELLQAFRSRLQCPAARRPEDGRPVAGRVAEGRPRAAPVAAAGRLDDHATARPLLFPAGPDQPLGRRRPVPRRGGPAAPPRHATGGPRDEQAVAEDGGGAADPLARAGAAPAVSGRSTQAKQEIFARYASFIYLGNGRYGFAAAAAYYFDRELASFTADDAGIAALLAGIGKSPQEYAPEAGESPAAQSPQPDPRPDGAQRLPSGEPRAALSGRADPRCPTRRAQDRRARRGRARARRAAPGRRHRESAGGSLRGTDRGSLDGRRARPGDRQRGSGTGPGRVRGAAPQEPRIGSGLGGRARQRGCGDPGRGRRQADLRRARHALLRLQPGHRLAAPAGVGDEAAGVHGGLRRRHGPRHRGARRADRRARRERWRHQVDRQLRTPSSRARSRCGRPWPSRATPWRCG